MKPKGQPQKNNFNTASIKRFFILLAFLAFTTGHSQILDPVKWKTRVEKISDTEYNLISEATLDKDWHVYSQYTPDLGPLPLEIAFEDQKGNYQTIGKLKESPYKKHFNDAFGVEEYYFSDKFTLTQKVKVINPQVNKISIILNYQVCKESCINDVKKLTFDLPEVKAQTAQILVDTISIDTVAAPEVTTETTVSTANAVKMEQPKEEKNTWSIFLGCIAAGLFATITPCVFPMIPMTVSFFLKQSKNRVKGKFNAFFYGFCIVAICVIISLPFHLIEGLNPDIFSEISTNVYLNLFFFLIFVVFAISFFGAFEITIPSRFANRVDNASNSGGLAGIFFMALTLIIVSFSCIGPALGFVLGTVLNSDGGATILSIAMLGFGIGLALPFMFFAFAPSLLGNLPKSGGWLNTVKVVFGFIELALAFKFLSNADLVLQYHLLEREVFLAIWIATFGALALYLFGKFSLPHDSPLPFLSVGRMLFGVLVLSFTIYLVPGLWGAPLKLISAFPPPMTYSESPLGFGGGMSSVNTEALPEGAVYGPHNIISFEDYATGLAYAKKINKPVLIDFTGRACQNCRLMENNVWSDEQVLKILKSDIVLISLYGDENIALPENEQYVSKETGIKIKDVGQKWREFQRMRYGSNARPLYVLMDQNEQPLNTPVPYTPNIEEYLAWLKEGVSKFKK